MSATRMNNLDLLAPAVVETVQRRALAVGVVFAVLAALGAVCSLKNSSPPICLGTWRGSGSHWARWRF